jgi:hypothetical protein
MLLGLVRFFGPGVTELLRVMWSPEEGGAGSGGGEVEAEAEAGLGQGTGALEGGQPLAVSASDVSGLQTSPSLAASSDTVALQTALERLAAVYRELPEVVPELITGDSVAELDAALRRAREAYARLAARLSGAEEGGGQARVRVTVPAGGRERRSEQNAANLTAVQKIALGLEQRIRSR